MKRQASLLSDTTLTEFFRDELGTAFRACEKNVEPETEYYLVDMLTRTAELSTRPGAASTLDEPLAFKLNRGLESHGIKRWLAFRDLGEAALLLSSIFSDLLNRKLVDVEYCRGMGKNAYRRLCMGNANGVGSGGPRSAFDEVASRFGEISDVLLAFWTATRSGSNRDLLRMYEVWVRTHNPHLQRELAMQGIFTNHSASLTHH